MSENRPKGIASSATSVGKKGDSDVTINIRTGGVKPGIWIADAKIPTMTQRKENFQRLVAENFAGTGELDMESVTWEPSKRNHNISAYRYLEEYALTDFGALMVLRILADNRLGGDRFAIGLQDVDKAGGKYNGIYLPTKFPKALSFESSGQKVLPVAVIHHEFGHTKFNPKNKIVHEYSLNEERETVLFFENPVRMLGAYKGRYEPRYSYTRDKGDTINIITGVIYRGQNWKISPSDPSVMVAR